MQKNSRHDDEPGEEIEFPAIPAGPDGGIDAGVAAGMISQPATVPERTPENFKCLQGPCLHYWHLVTMAQEGNPEDTWEHLGIAAPRQHHYTCLLNPGYETTFADDNAYECDRHAPLMESELVQIKARREDYYRRFPEHRPTEVYETPEEEKQHD